MVAKTLAHLSGSTQVMGSFITTKTIQVWMLSLSLHEFLLMIKTDALASDKSGHIECEIS